MLTGKCKEAFEKWLSDSRKIAFGIANHNGEGGALYYMADLFDGLDFSCQYGVIVDFFDSVGIKIEIQVRIEPTMQGSRFRFFRPELLYKGRFYNVGASFGERGKSRKAAIEKANEIYNENNI